MKRLFLSVMAVVMILLPSTKTSAYERIPDVTEEEVHKMARCVMSEAGNQTIECKIGVAETVVNRVLSEDSYYPDTVTGVITQKGQYSLQDNGEVTDECYQAVYIALAQQNFDKPILYFRTNHFHKYGTPYRQIDDMYFSS